MGMLIYITEIRYAHDHAHAYTVHTKIRYGQGRAITGYISKSGIFTSMFIYQNGSQFSL